MAKAGIIGNAPRKKESLFTGIEVGPPPSQVKSPDSLFAKIDIGPPPSEQPGRGFWRSLVADPETKFPFSGGVVRASRFGDVVQASKRLQRDSYETERQRNIVRFQTKLGPGGIPLQGEDLRRRDTRVVEDYMVEAHRKYTGAGQVGRIVGEMPAFMIEFIGTGGLKKLGEGTAKRLGTKWLGQRAAKSLTGRAVIGTTAFMSGAAFRSAGMPHRAAEAILKRQLPLGITYGPEGEISIQDSGESPWTSVVKGLGDHYIEILSEQSGEVAAPILGKALGKTPFLGKVLTEAKAKWLSLPKNKLKTAADFSSQIGTKTGFNGVVSEIGEEFFGDSLRGLFDIDDFGAGKGAGPLERMNKAIERDLENLPVMAAAFAIPGVTRAVAARALAARHPDLPEEPPTAPRPVTPEQDAAQAGELRGALRDEFKDDQARAEAEADRLDDFQDAEEAELDAQLASMAEELTITPETIETEQQAAVAAQTPPHLADRTTEGQIVAPELTEEGKKVRREEGKIGKEEAAVTEPINVYKTTDGKKRGIQEAEIVLSDEELVDTESGKPVVLDPEASQSAGEKEFFHGSKTSKLFDVHKGGWVTTNREYAEIFGEKVSRVEQDQVSPQNVVDLTNIKVDQDTNVDVDLLKDTLSEHNIQLPQKNLGLSADTEFEMHQRVPHIVDAARKQGFTAIKINEWNLDFGSEAVETMFLFPAQPTAPKAELEKPARGLPDRLKSDVQKMIEAEALEETGKDQADPLAPTAERTEEELTGLSSARRKRIKKQTADTILANDIYKTALEAQDRREREIDVGLYFVDKSGKEEIDRVINSVPKGRFRTRLRKMFTFDPSDLVSKGGGAISWDVAVQNAFEATQGTEGHLDLTEFAERVKEALIGKSFEPGSKRLNRAAMDSVAESGNAFIEMMVNKHRMLHNGSTKQEINEMILDVGDHYNIDPVALVLDMIDGKKTLRASETRVSEADEDAADEKLARQQVEAEDKSDAEGAAKDILETNGIDVHIETVDEITAEELEKRLPEKRDDDVPFEVRGKPTGATLTLSDKQIILLANGADSQTGYHEGYHVLRSRLTAQDDKILKKTFANEEAEAAAFGEYAQDQSTQTGIIKTIFEKIMRFLRQVKSALEGAGFRTSEAIFSEITTGQIRKVSPVLGEPRTSFELKEPSEVFYSKLERSVAASMPNKMDAKSFGNWLKKREIKPDETKWTGIDELITQGKPITKEQALETIRTNDVKIEEVVKSGQDERGVGEEIQELQERTLTLNIRQEEIRNSIAAATGMSTGTEEIAIRATLGWPGSTREQSIQARSDLSKIMPTIDWNAAAQVATEFYDVQDRHSELANLQPDGPQFETYTLPGGRNYREVLLTLPVQDKAVTVVKAGNKWKVEIAGSTLGEFTTAALPQYDTKTAAEVAATNLRNARQRSGAVKAFTSPHFPEKNILTHLRLTDRVTLDGKKVLMIEEIQSDWMQEGRKRGFEKPIDTTGWTAKIIEEDVGLAVGKDVAKYSIHDAGGRFLGNSFGKSEEEAIASHKRNQKGVEGTKVPDAPFKKTWHKLAFKRALRYAAEEGYDVLAWTTGEQQADRYDLSKQVDEIWVRQLPISVYPEGRYELHVIKEESEILTDVVDARELADLIGKDLADKIIRGGSGRQSFTGLDLKIGGEGMKAFYDRHIPNFARKYLKEWGGTVGTTEINTPTEMDPDEGGTIFGTETVHAVDVTPAMVKSVLAGQVKFETRGEKIQREANKNSRIKAKKARIKDARTKKVSRKRLSFQTKVETPFLRADLAPAELPPGKMIQPAPAPIKGIRKKLPGPTFSEEGMEAHRDAVKRTLNDAKAAKFRNWGLEAQRKVIVMSTRLADIDPLLSAKVREYEFDTMSNALNLLLETSAFINKVRKIKGKDIPSLSAMAQEKYDKPLSELTPEQKTEVERLRKIEWDKPTPRSEDAKDLQYALENQWRAKTNEILYKYSKIKGFENIEADYEVVREILEELYNEGQGVGFDTLHRANHFPRRVKYLEELLDYLATTEDWSAFQTALQSRKDQGGGRDLTESEQSDVINTLLRGYRIGGVSLSRPGVVKHRSVPEFDAQIARFYYPLSESLEMYIQDMVQMIAARRFFGKQHGEITKLRTQERRWRTRLHKLETRVGVTKPVTEEKHKEHISKGSERLKEITEELHKLSHKTLNQSIAKFALDLRAAGKLDANEQRRLEEMLNAIFEPQGLGPNMNLFAQLTYLTLLSNIPVAMTQLQEIGLSYIESPVRATAELVRTALKKNRLELHDIGIHDIDQFTKDLGLSTVVRKAIFAMRFTDKFGKQALLNTLMEKAVRTAKTTPNNARFVSEMKRIFGPEFRNVINDLAAERITRNVKLLMFNKILDVQPLAISETPEGFAIGGNWRIAYVLRQFTLRRFNMIRDDARIIFKQPFKDDPLRWAGAFADLLKELAILTLFGVGVDFIRDFWLGLFGSSRKDFDIGQSALDNMLEFVLLSQWTLDNAQRQGPTSAIIEEFAPPFKLAEGIWIDGRTGRFERTIRSLPAPFAEEYYWWFGGGSRKGERNEFLDIYDPFN